MGEFNPEGVEVVSFPPDSPGEADVELGDKASLLSSSKL